MFSKHIAPLVAMSPTVGMALMAIENLTEEVAKGDKPPMPEMTREETLIVLAKDALLARSKMN